MPTLAHEEDVLALLAKVFEEVDVKRRGSTKKAPDVFRFDSTRFIGKLRSADGATMPVEIAKIKFEVQIKSAFEHAWAVTTHALTYKGTKVKWNRLRLTAQLKAAVEQLDLLVLAFEETSLRIDESLWPELEAKENIATFFRLAVAGGKIVLEELTPKDWSRFSDSVYSLASDSARGARRQPAEIADVIKIADKCRTPRVGGRQNTNEYLALAVDVWHSMQTWNCVAATPPITSEYHTRT